MKDTLLRIKLHITKKKNAYYDLIETEDATNRIFEEFGLDGTGHIINGHVPVHQSEGENPLKCDGKVIMIDGGFQSRIIK